AGRPYPDVECRLSAEGELLVRGPNVFAGYWRDPEATAAALRDGWLVTGDLAERDADGDYWIRGRLKELVVSGGENVYPAEIEAVLHEHPDVVEAAVVGVPDERWGEVCAAFVVLRTFYLYFDSKKAVFDELVRDLNQRVRYAMKEGSTRGHTRLEAELLGFRAFFRFTAEHPALYRIIRQAEFVSPEMLHYHYE